MVREYLAKYDEATLIIVPIAVLAILAFIAIIAVFLLDRRNKKSVLPANPNLKRYKLRPTGLELFTDPLLPGRVYQLRFIGKYHFIYGIIFDNHAYADAIYAADPVNYTKKYSGLRIDGRPIASGELDGWRADRCEHRYGFEVEGQGERMVVQLYPPRSIKRSDDYIFFELELLPEGTPSARALREAAAQARTAALAEVARLAEEQRLREEEALARAAAEEQDRIRQAEEGAESRARQERAEAWEREQQERVLRLALRVHRERNIFDVKFRTAFVKKHRDQLTSEWRDSWGREYDRLLSDIEFVNRLRRDTPQVLEWFERRIEMVLAAERQTVMSRTDFTAALDGPRSITRGTLDDVQYHIDKLRELRSDYDRLREWQAEKNTPGQHDEGLQQIRRLVRFHRRELRAYGIVARSPEGADVKLAQLLPPVPAPPVQRGPAHFYMELQSRLQSGEKLGKDAIKARLNDLHRENIILSAKRRAAVRDNALQDKEYFDYQLCAVRAEFAQLKVVLESMGDVFQPEDERGEQSRAQRFLDLDRERREISGKLDPTDQETRERVDNMYAQEQAKLFEDESESYT